jgi:hypothetical protein
MPIGLPAKPRQTGIRNVAMRAKIRIIESLEGLSSSEKGEIITKHINTDNGDSEIICILAEERLMHKEEEVRNFYGSEYSFV